MFVLLKIVVDPWVQHELDEESGPTTIFAVSEVSPATFTNKREKSVELGGTGHDRSGRRGSVSSVVSRASTHVRAVKIARVKEYIIDSVHEIGEFLAFVFNKYLFHVSKNKQVNYGVLDNDVIKSYVNNDIDWIHKRLKSKGVELTYKFFLSQQFPKLLQKLHFQRTQVSDKHFYLYVVCCRLVLVTAPVCQKMLVNVLLFCFLMFCSA